MGAVNTRVAVYNRTRWLSHSRVGQKYRSGSTGSSAQGLTSRSWSTHWGGVSSAVKSSLPVHSGCGQRPGPRGCRTQSPFLASRQLAIVPRGLLLTSPLTTMTGYSFEASRTMSFSCFEFLTSEGPSPLLCSHLDWVSEWSVSQNRSVVSNSLQPHGLQSPWNSPGQNTGVGSLSLLQRIFPTQGSNPGLPHCRWLLYQLSHKGSPRILEWIAYPFSSGSSQPRNQTGVSCIAGKFFTNWATREALIKLGLFISLLNSNSVGLERNYTCKNPIN